MLPPAVTVCEPGVAEIEKSGGGGGLTVKLTAAECVRLPLVPVIVNVKVPVEVVLEVVQVSVEVPEPPLIEVGLKLQVAPVGAPLTLKLTVPLKLLRDDTEAV